MIDSTPSAAHQQLQQNLLKKKPVKNTVPGAALKILSLEDTLSDQELLSQQLKKSGLHYQLLFVDTQAGFESALSDFNPDIILSDYNLPTYHGVDAFYTAKQQLPQAPFILVSGTIGEQRAVEMIKGGATDYVIKDALFTLPSVIDRAMKEANERREKIQAHAELRLSAHRLARAQALAHLGSWEVNLVEDSCIWSDEACRIHGIETTNNHHNFESWFSFIHPDDRERVANEVKAHYTATGNITFNYRIITPGGQLRYLYTEAQFERDETGRPVTMQGVVHDITSRHEAEEKLKQSEAGLARAQALAHLGSWEMDPVTTLSTLSEECRRIYGLEPGKRTISVTEYLAIIHPDDLERMTKGVAESVNNLTDVSIYHRIVHKNGDVRYLHTEAKNQFDANGKYQMLHGTARDITQQHEAEEKLKQSEARLARAQEVAHLGNWELDLDTDTAFWSDETLRIFGMQPGQNTRALKDFMRIVHPDDLAFVTKQVKERIAMHTESQFEHRIIRADGTVRHIHNQGVHQLDPSGKKHIMHGIVHDITERIERETKLKQSEARLARAQQVARLGNWELDLNTGMAFWDDETLRICGLTPGQNVHNMQEYVAMIHPDDMAFVAKEIEDSIVNNTDSSIEHRIVRPDGEIRYIHNVGTHQPDPTGKTRLMHGIVQDITDRKLARQKLDEAEQTLKELFDNTADYIYSVDKDYRLTTCNKAFADNFYNLFGKRPVIGENFIDAIPANIRAITRSRYEKAFLGQPIALEEEYQLGDMHQWYSTKYNAIIRNGETVGIAMFGSNITERKVAEIKRAETEQHIAEIFENTTDYICSLDKDLNLVSYNHAYYNNFVNVFGRKPVIGEYYLNILPETQRADAELKYRQVLKGEVLVNEADYDFNGHHFWFITKFSPVRRNGEITGLAFFSTDITERKMAELKLRESEANLSDVFHNTNDYICSVDKDLKLISFNKAFADSFSKLLKTQPVIGDNYLNLMPEELRTEAMEKYQRVLQGETTSSEREFVSNGKSFWIASKYNPIVRNGQITGVAFFASDITERKLAEAKLQESQANLKDVFDNTADFISSFDKDRVLLSCNKAFANRFRFLSGAAPVLGQVYPGMFADQAGAAPGANFNRALTGESISVVEEFDYQGNKFWFSVRYNPIIRNEQITGVAIFSNDITESKVAADKLHESQAALKDVFDNTADFICSFDKDRKLVAFNKAFADNLRNLTGTEPALGSVYNDKFGEANYTLLNSQFNRALQGEHLTGIEEFEFGAKKHWFSVRYSPIIRNGQITGVAVFSNDITKQKNAETLLHKSFDELQIASEKQSAILNTLPANIALLDKNGVVIKVNDAWRKFAYDNDMKHGNSGLGENYISVSEAAGGPDGPYAHRMAEGLKLVIAGKLEKFSMEYPCHSPGKQRWFKAEVTPLEGYDELGAVVMHLDITDRNKAEEEVKNLNRDLEKKIAERTAQLEIANKEMEAFSYTVSHDLRSPLQVINGYASILERKYKPQLDEGAHELLAGIKSNTVHMSQLIADLLNFSHLGRAELKRNNISMNDLVAVVINELKATTPNFKHTITIHPLTGVTADAGLIHQVWVNLIANAIKYSGNKPNPTIEIGMTRINNEDVFYVKDNGAGFDMMYYDKLFTVFHRLHKPSEFEGTGVGLALVHSVITRHGGRVWAEAKVNEGATFYFTLPDVSRN